MKKFLKLLAVMALFCLVLVGGSRGAYAHTADDSIWLIDQNGSPRAYFLSLVRSETEGKPILLRNSCMDDPACDMSFVQSAMDFAVRHGTVKLKIKLTDDEYRTVKDYWQDGKDGKSANIVFPALSWINISNKDDKGMYTLSFGFPRYGKETDEELAKKVDKASGIARQIVGMIPDRCTSDTDKAEYLYAYITETVKYYDDSDDFHDYYRSGKDVCLAYDTLLTKETVCAGFAYTFAYLCELAGIDAQYVVVAPETVSDTLHAVVMAKVNNSYHWFDPTSDEGNNMTGFQWFGLSDQEFRKHSGTPNTFYARSLYPKCDYDLHLPFGYWDFDTVTYRRFHIFDPGVDEGRYIISTAMDDNRVLEIGGYSTENGGNAQLWWNDFIDFQQFQISEAGSETYTLKNCGSSLMLDVEGGSTASGTNVQQYERNNTAAQKWKLVRSGDNGFYYIKSSLGGLCLEVAGDSAVEGANVCVSSSTYKPSQKWRLTRVTDSVPRPGRYVLTSAMDNNRALQFSSDYNAQIYWNWFGPSQMFDVYGEGSGYVLKECSEGRYLYSYKPYNSAESGPVYGHGYSYYGKESQQWTFKSAGDGYYYIKSVKDNLYLEVAGDSASDYTTVRVGSFTGKDNQKWRFNMIKLFT